MKYEIKNIKKCIDGMEWNKYTDKDLLKYAVGALMYTPALHENISESICDNKYKNLKSTVFCLEDAILDQNLEQAEQKICGVTKELYCALSKGTISIENIPLLFIRFRSPSQMWSIYTQIKDFADVITGFVLPKFDLENIDEYKEVIENINSDINLKKPLYIMPIIESASVVNILKRTEILTGVKNSLNDISKYVLNVRIGGNDFCNQFGVRRNINNTIYDIKPVSDIISDIINIFGRDYVVSAPVWEYFGDDKDISWKKGLNRELEYDMLNGLIGKTAIHPSQLEIIQESLTVNYNDYCDAKSILNWDDSMIGVKKSADQSRMNEFKVHKKWAEKIMSISKIYGVKSNEKNC